MTLVTSTGDEVVLDRNDPRLDGARVHLGLLGVVLEGIDALLGLDCSPITVIGVGTGNECSATTVCCQDNSVVSTSVLLNGSHATGVHSPLLRTQGGLISIGCIPIIL